MAKKWKMEKLIMMLLNYPLFEAIFNRRSRRFGAGMSCLRQ